MKVSCGQINCSCSSVITVTQQNVCGIREEAINSVCVCVFMKRNQSVHESGESTQAAGGKDGTACDNEATLCNRSCIIIVDALQPTVTSCS